jgi:hypothetical protein
MVQLASAEVTREGKPSEGVMVCRAHEAEGTDFVYRRFDGIVPQV